MKKLFVILCCLMSIMFTGCLTITIPVRRAEMNFDSSKPLNETMDVITYILHEKAFEVESVNEKFGIIYTKWKKINYSNTGMTLIAAATTGTAATYSRYVKLDFKITENGYTVSPREKQVNTINKFAQQSTNEIEIELVPTSNEGKDIQKIVEEINKLLNIEGAINWTIYDNVVQ